jgi:hypothetical protein
MNVEMLARLEPSNWPGSASGIIRHRLLQRSSPLQGRVLAAELAGDLIVMNDKLARALLGLVRDNGEAPALRGRAAISLGPVLEEAEWFDPDDPLDDPPRCSDEVVREIRGALADVYRDAEAPGDVRRRVLEASVRGTEAWHEAAVRAAYHSGDVAWRRTATFCMRYVPGFDDEILEALSSEDPDVVFEAVGAAGDRGVEAAWARIRALLRDVRTDKPTLLAAIEAAGYLEAPADELQEAISDLLASEDEEIADAASDALVELELRREVEEGSLEDEW